MTIAVYKIKKESMFYLWWYNHFKWLFKLVKKRKEHVWKSDTIFRCLGLPLVSYASLKVCLRDNRVFLIYLARYDRTIINIEFWRFFGIELLALSDNAILFTLTPGNDKFVLVFMWLTFDQTQLIHKLMVWPIYS